MSLTKVSYSMIDAAPINVADYGATGDGTTDDTVAIQAAFNAVSATGGTIVFEPGKTYMIDGSYLPIQTLFGGVKPKSGTIIQGNSAKLKVITSSATGYCVLNLNAVSNIAINDLNIEGDVGRHIGTTGEFGHGLMIMGCDNVVLNNLFITLCWGDAVLFSEYVRVNGNTNVDVNNCEFVDCRRQGVSVIDLSNGTFIGCSFRNIGATALTSPASVGATAKMRNVFEIISCDIKGQVLVDNCKIIGGQIILEEIYTNSQYAVESVADLPFQMIGTSVFVTGTRRAAFIGGATSESSRKLVQNCKFNQDNNTLPDLDQWAAMGGFITLDNCQMTRTGAAPATGYNFQGAADFTGFDAKMVNCYLDPKLAVGFAQDGLMVRVAQRGWASAAPTTGTYSVGQIVLNSTPASAGFIGFVCTVAGTPGTWRTFGLIS